MNGKKRSAEQIIKKLREADEHVRTRQHVSQRRACRVLGQAKSFGSD